MFVRFAVRDLVLVSLALVLWWALAERSDEPGFVADFAGFVAGAGLGVAAAVLHEWGHVLGGWASGSRMSAGASLRSSFIFHFHARENSLRQFLVMSFGGFVVTAALVVSYYAFLPDGWLATRVARGAVLFLAFLGVALEAPLVAVALVRGSVPDAVSVEGPQRTGRAAA